VTAACTSWWRWGSRDVSATRASWSRRGLTRRGLARG